MRKENLNKLVISDTSCLIAFTNANKLLEDIIEKMKKDDK